MWGIVSKRMENLLCYISSWSNCNRILQEERAGKILWIWKWEQKHQKKPSYVAKVLNLSCESFRGGLLYSSVTMPVWKYISFFINGQLKIYINYKEIDSKRKLWDWKNEKVLIYSFRLPWIYIYIYI